MSIVARWKTTCDGCGMQVEKEIALDLASATGFGYLDIWGPGFPHGWLQVATDRVTGQHYLFFHDRECYSAWLRRQGRDAEADEFDHSIWVA